MRGLRMLPGSWLLLLTLLAACGGRTAFDSDQSSLDPSRPIGDGASPSPGPGPSIGGNTGANDATDAACSKWCTAQALQACGLEAECTRPCREEVGRQTPACQKNATLMIDCIVAAYQNNQDCSAAEQMARDQCALWITAYQGCSVGQPASPSPAEPPPAPPPPAPPPPAPPPPAPPPPAPPPPAPPPAGCSGTGSVNAFNCTLSMKCEGRSYDDIYCKQNPAGSSSCACGSRFVILDERVDTACSTGIWNCVH